MRRDLALEGTVGRAAPLADRPPDEESTVGGSTVETEVCPGSDSKDAIAPTSPGRSVRPASAATGTADMVGHLAALRELCGRVVAGLHEAVAGLKSNPNDSDAEELKFIYFQLHSALYFVSDVLPDSDEDDEDVEDHEDD